MKLLLQFQETFLATLIKLFLQFHETFLASFMKLLQLIDQHKLTPRLIFLGGKVKICFGAK